MINQLHRSIILIVVSVLWGCSNQDESKTENLDPIGSYSYSAFDTDNNVIGKGTIKITENKNGVLIGEKDIMSLSENSSLLPEAGKGAIHGNFKNSTEIELYLWETGGPYLIVSGKLNSDSWAGERKRGSDTSIGLFTVGKFTSAK